MLDLVWIQTVMTLSDGLNFAERLFEKVNHENISWRQKNERATDDLKIILLILKKYKILKFTVLFLRPIKLNFKFTHQFISSKHVYR